MKQSLNSYFLRHGYEYFTPAKDLFRNGQNIVFLSISLQVIANEQHSWSFVSYLYWSREQFDPNELWLPLHFEVSFWTIQLKMDSCLILMLFVHNELYSCTVCPANTWFYPVNFDTGSLCECKMRTSQCPRIDPPSPHLEYWNVQNMKKKNSLIEIND